jgi:5'-nucleotidase
VLAHAGAFQQGDDAAGEIVNEARQMSGAVDVVVAGHTHSKLNLNVDGKLVVQALSYGVAFDRVNITVDRDSGDVVSKSATIAATDHQGVDPDPELAALVDRYRKRIAPLANRVLGHTDERLDNEAVDRLAADAQRAFAGADIAFLNPGNTRSDIDAGPITYADAFEVQAYEHPVWRIHMRGAELIDAERDQPGLLVSGTRDLRPDAVYTVAVNGIVADRAPFDRGADRVEVGTDLQALVAWLERRYR